ncbi:SAM-dependent methyltransferase [Methylobacterium organophilum]|uniref:class I SAM-dependent methyltransferase n=1 Tax=Methylobacterium organophilum TaxID=410 RepID=UPI001F12E520|nr:SAM-dependent methyltransferase [Methylobacterium organophilum]UMY18040.1 SAM-dependent methyltransferase [Methylobacterium organophilum]
MTPLFRLIAQEIRDGGPIGLDRYMALCLGHPEHGYYRTRDPLGRAGDFVTAPEISQMFGELIGVWVAATRAAMGHDGPLHLVELGPGRGTLMADALRALRAAAPGAAFSIHLVETSPVLRAAQRQRLDGAGFPVAWHDTVETVPDGPAIVLANEFFDALPVRQFERTTRGWCERRIGLSEDGTALRFGLAPEPTPGLDRAGPTGVLLTVPAAGLDLARRLGRRLARQDGAGLVIDYGHTRPGFGDSFQALAGHRFADPLAAPGEADLTTHVDFTALTQAATAEGALVHGPVDQRDFLLALGLPLRADRLKAKATPAQAEAIDAAVARLTDPSRRGMGALFKVLALSGPALAALPALPAAA